MIHGFIGEGAERLIRRSLGPAQEDRYREAAPIWREEYAKRLLARELGAVVLRPCGETHRNLTAAEPHVCWPAAEAGHAEWVDLAPGVRERVAGAYTAAVVFDPAHGWDADRAEAWLAEHLPASPGRVAVLPRALLPMPRPVAVGS